MAADTDDVRHVPRGELQHIAARILRAAGSEARPGGDGRTPGWVRLVRVGDHFDGYRSADGVAWTLMSSVDIPMAPAVYVGLAMTSHNASRLATAR